jgi:predicted dithiol-disulfide oxidoreductase (DUF899 family)
MDFPNETPAYRAARDRLLAQEVALRRQTEAVAAERRALPPGGAVPKDYVFEGLDEDGRPAPIRLSELFAEGDDTLVIYNYMFPAAPDGATPCSGCTELLDQLDGAALHYRASGGSFAVVARASLDQLLALARDRHWRHLRLLSSAGNGFKRDYHAEEADGQAVPLTTVFRRDSNGTIRLFWASEMLFAPSDPGQDHRAAGTLEPLWNLFDLGPNGRPDHNAQLSNDDNGGGAATPPRQSGA